MFIVITYDVPVDKRRTRLHTILKSYGQWVQYSVFECDLTQTEYARLRNRLDRVINPEEDSIRFYFLCSGCHSKVERIGGELPGDETLFFV